MDFCRITVFGLSALLAGVASADSLPQGEFPVSMGNGFVRGTATPVQHTVAFEAPVAGSMYFLRLNNGKNGLAVTSAEVEVNGNRVLGPNNFKKHSTFLEVPITLKTRNKFSVILKGKPGSDIEINIIGIDRAPPTIEAAVEPDPNAAGWHRDNATVSFSCDDAISGVVSCSGPVTVSAEGAKQRVEGTAVDLAQNSASTYLDVSLDRTPPVLTSAVAPEANAKGWQREPVTINYSCSDNLSGVVACPDAKVLNEEGAAQVVESRIVDVADNSARDRRELNIDLTPPQIASTITPVANASGWHKTAPTLTYSCDDALSGVESCSEEVVVEAETADRRVTGQVTDNAGNSAEVSDTVRLDMTAPIITTAVSPAANDAGWHNVPTTLSYSCSDALSGVASCSDDAIVDTETAEQTVTGSVEDIAGNFAEVTDTVRLDMTAPVITTTISPEANEAGWHKSPPTLSYSCEDALSGVASCSDSQLIEIETAEQIVAGQVVDLASNTAEVSDTVRLDLTPPTIAATYSSEPNAAGWYSGPVTITYTCDDQLSGIKSCEPARTINREGFNLLTESSAVDVAGNTAEHQARISIDQQAPFATFILPVNNVNVAKDKPTVRLIVMDNLSLDEQSLRLSVNGAPNGHCQVNNGVASCELDTALPEGLVTLSLSLADLAGNDFSTQITVALDSDIDGVANHIDSCADTPLGEVANTDGCSQPQLDDDADGLVNRLDQCLNTAANTLVDGNGCDLDSDGDGIGDTAELAAGSDPANGSDFPPLVLKSFTATPNIVRAHSDVVVVSWDVEGAESIELVNDVDDQVHAGLNPQGSISLRPNVTTRYTLKLKGIAEERDETIEVDVQLPAPPMLWPTSVALDRTSGEQVGTSLSMADDGSSYVGAFDNHYYKISANGQVAWVLKNAGVVMNKAAIEGDQLVIGADIGDITGSEGGRLYSLSTDKTIHWQLDAASPITASPIFSADNATVYAVSYTGEILAVNAADGELLWQFQLPEGLRVFTAPTYIASNNSLIIHTLTGELVAINASLPGQLAGERVLWTRQLDE